MIFVSAIVVAAGKGKRFRSKIPKPLVKIGDLPIILYSLKALAGLPMIKEIIVAANPENIKSITGKIRQYKIYKAKKIILGGKRRQDSVQNALRSVDKRANLVLIHDAARPFADRKIIGRVIKESKKCGAVVVGVPIKATIKEVHSSQFTVHSKFVVKKTIDRTNLWEIQTPQVFRKDLILGAYKKFGHLDVTDDAMLVEKSGRRVAVVMGSYNNIKITTPEDLVLAKMIASRLCTK